MKSSGHWLSEKVTPFDEHRHKLRKTLVRTETAFQKAVLADSHSLGRCLVLDGELQSAGRDEFIYHEALVHPAMNLHANAKQVLIMGGGEGATARELLRYARLQQVTMVDIDGQVVDFAKRYLHTWHRGAFRHPKLRLVIDDAKRFIDQSMDHYDVIFSDLPTPASAREPLAALYTSSFYRKIKQRLASGGVLVVQAGPGHWYHMEFQRQLSRILHGIFTFVRPYFAFVPSFDEPWSFLLASERLDALKLSAQVVDKRLGNLKKTLRFYDGQTHEGLFKIPKYLRQK